MVGRVWQRTNDLTVTLTDLVGRVLFQETVGDGRTAARRAAIAIAQRDPLQAGDLLRVTRPQDNGPIHQPREID
jgi:hypothetical protein